MIDPQSFGSKEGYCCFNKFVFTSLVRHRELHLRSGQKSLRTLQNLRSVWEGLLLRSTEWTWWRFRSGRPRWRLSCRPECRTRWCRKSASPSERRSRSRCGRCPENLKIKFNKLKVESSLGKKTTARSDFSFPETTNWPFWILYP